MRPRANPGILRKITISCHARNWTLDYPDHTTASTSTTPSQLPYVLSSVFNYYLAVEIYVDNEVISHQESHIHFNRSEFTRHLNFRYGYVSD